MSAEYADEGIRLDFRTAPEHYRHWRVDIDGPIATLTMAVDESKPAFDGYELKLNSYDISVDIELYDAAQRLRFEHPQVKCVVLASDKPSMFCAGANIRMLGLSSHRHKVNFCKFTNETRNSLEDASRYSGQTYMAAVNGTAAGGGYELALATDHILLVDDGNAAVSLPEVPLLAVLPGTGGLTRLVDKRMVRRDLADVFCTLEEGIRGQRAVDWRLVDEIAPTSRFKERIRERALALASTSDRPDDGQGLELSPLERNETAQSITYDSVRVELDRAERSAIITVRAPQAEVPASAAAALESGVNFWPLALARELDDALLHLRFNEPELGTLVLKTEGDAEQVMAFDEFLQAHQEHWFIREVLLFLKRTFKRLDVSSRTLIALVETGSCFHGMLAELLLTADRAYMLDGVLEDDDRPADIALSALNFGTFTMPNGLSRLATRFLGSPERIEELRQEIGRSYDAQAAWDAGLVTMIPDDIDWEDEIRLVLEERASFSPDALIGLEANLRFAGPETVESKIFGRLTAWQNWIFQRPNAVSEEGALRAYGTGKRPQYDKKRV